MALVPTTSASAGLGVIGFMNAAFGFRAVFFAVERFAMSSSSPVEFRRGRKHTRNAAEVKARSAASGAAGRSDCLGAPQRVDLVRGVARLGEDGERVLPEERGAAARIGR